MGLVYRGDLHPRKGSVGLVYRRSVFNIYLEEFRWICLPSFRFQHIARRVPLDLSAVIPLSTPPQEGRHLAPPQEFRCVHCWVLLCHHLKSSVIDTPDLKVPLSRSSSFLPWGSPTDNISYLTPRQEFSRLHALPGEFRWSRLPQYRSARRTTRFACCPGIPKTAKQNKTKQNEIKKQQTPLSATWCVSVSNFGTRIRSFDRKKAEEKIKTSTEWNKKLEKQKLTRAKKSPTRQHETKTNNDFWAQKKQTNKQTKRIFFFKLAKQSESPPILLTQTHIHTYDISYHKCTHGKQSQPPYVGARTYDSNTPTGSMPWLHSSRLYSTLGRYRSDSVAIKPLIICGQL